MAAFALPVSPAFGEGSVDVNTGPDANSRHGLIMSNVGNLGDGANDGAYTILYVYAQAGETIQLGNSAMAFAGTNIHVYAPGTNLEGLVYPTDPAFLNDEFDCRTNDAGTGVIPDGAPGRAQEIAGPLPNAGGYNACEYTPTTTGIFPVIMTSPDPAGGTGPGTVGVPNQAANSWAIAIWDITVRNASGAQSGRVFSDQFYFWETAPPVASGGVQVFPYTRTGYTYQVDMFEHNGGGWSLRADDQGIVDAATGERKFASFACHREVTGEVENVCTDFRAGFAPLDGRYPLFVNEPDPIVITGPGGLAATRGYAATPISPAANPLGSTFTGSGGEAGATKRGAGGTINVTSPAQMAGLGSTLEIDINRNNVWGDAPDYVDTQELEADGTNTYAWNGRDAAGDVPACGDYPYRVRSTLSEVHFPMYDVESSGGTQIRRLSLPNDSLLRNVYAASYDDRDPYKGRNVTDTNPIVADSEISDSTFHAWGDDSAPLDIGGGTTDYIDTWTRLPEVDDQGTLRLLCSDPQVVKTAEPSKVTPGRDLTFRLEVKNNGPDAATDVSVVDDLPDTVTFERASQGCSEAAGVVTCGLASLAPGATHTFEIVVAVPSELDDCVQNSATVTNTTFDTNLANNSSEDCWPLRRESDLSIDKEASSATVAPGGQVMFTLVVRNQGPSDDPSAKVSDPLAAGLSLASAQSSQGTCTTTNNTLNCDLGGLKAGGSAQVLVTVNVTATSGCITNTARVRGANSDPTPENNQDSAQVCPNGGNPSFDLVVRKTVNDRTPVIGQTARYRVVVRNNGPAAAPDVTMTDTLNAPVKVVSVRSTQGSCQRRIPMRCELGTIAAGERVTITIRAKHRESGCRQVNAASATGDGTDTNPANNMDTVRVCPPKVRVILTKVASRERVRGGERFSYRIRVRNPTKGEARNVKVCDRLPFGLRYVGSKPKAKINRRQRRQCWTIKRLKAGKSRTFRITVRAANGASGRKTNTATATSPDIRGRRLRARDRVNIEPRADRPTG